MSGLGRFLGGMKVAMSQNLQHAFVAEFEHDIAASARRQAAFAGQQALLRGLWSLLAAGVAGMTMLVGLAILHLSGAGADRPAGHSRAAERPRRSASARLPADRLRLPAWQAVTAMDGELAAAASPPAGDDGARRWRGRRARRRRLPLCDADGAGGLRGVTIRIEPGEMVGISGASGAGKTTLADLLIGLVQPQSGRVAIGGEPLTRPMRRAGAGRSPISRRIRCCSTRASGATCAGPIRARTRRGSPRRSRRRRGPLGRDAAAGAGHDRRRARNLISGGERQRLALARALMRSPAILILDEATGAIDIAGEARILARLRALDPRPTIVMIAHRSESLAFCDRIVTSAGGPDRRRTGARRRARDAGPARRIRAAGRLLPMAAVAGARRGGAAAASAADRLGRGSNGSSPGIGSPLWLLTACAGPGSPCRAAVRRGLRTGGGGGAQRARHGARSLRLPARVRRGRDRGYVRQGIALALLAYGELGVKQSWDIDLLAAPEDALAGRHLLERLGYG